MAITLRQLEIFQKVALTEHITKAAENLYISQSAVSMAISDLEKELSGLLFERRGRRLVLNERGRMLLNHANRILKEIDYITEMMRDTNVTPAGVLHVGASTTIGNYLLPKLIGDFTRLCPQTEVQLYVGNTFQVETEVQAGNLDLGLVEGPSHLTTLDCIPWRGDELVVIAGPELDWASDGKATEEMLTNARWIVREKGSGTREVFEEAMIKKGLTFNISLELGHTEAIKKAVEAGLGISCLSRLTVQRELDNRWLREVKTSLDLNRKLAVLVHKEKYFSKLLQAFFALIKGV